MILKKWDNIPENIRLDEVKPYYDSLINKQFMLIIKRLFDLLISFIMIILLLPLFLIVSILIKLDSNGPVFYKQERITQYGKIFRIFKFRSMIIDADKGSLITSSNDSRITKIGKLLRKTKLDELPQLFNVFVGDMTFVGTRPEVKKYVDKYTNEMKATLLLPAGITSKASYEYKDENKLILNNDDIDEVYIKKILPNKMKYNLEYLNSFSLLMDIKICINTLKAIL